MAGRMEAGVEDRAQSNSRVCITITRQVNYTEISLLVSSNEERKTALCGDGSCCFHRGL